MDLYDNMGFNLNRNKMKSKPHLDLIQRKHGETFKIGRKTYTVTSVSKYSFCQRCAFYIPGKCKLTDKSREITGECDDVIFEEVKK